MPKYFCQVNLSFFLLSILKQKSTLGSHRLAQPPRNPSHAKMSQLVVSTDNSDLFTAVFFSKF